MPVSVVVLVTFGVDKKVSLRKKFKHSVCWAFDEVGARDCSISIGGNTA